MTNKAKIFFVFALAIVSVGLVFSSASAQEKQAGKVEKNSAPQNGKQQQVVQATATTTASAATTEEKAPQEKNEKEKVKKVNKQLSGDSHRVSMSTFVSSVLAVADRQPAIGQELRTIANEQNKTKDRASELINAVEGRSEVKTFFIGTSYKNLGELRSQMVQAKNQIEQMKKLSEKAENPEDKAELQAQIETLTAEQTKIEGFITKNEDKFSLFGWAVKLFRK